MAAAQETYKNRNDPGRFFGDGVIFKAKLIGILEVGEARGDRMCQEALQDLKMAIRAAGEHKQRITINVTIDGLRLRDERTGDSLYHHPVHKISFIAQDMTDSRAFGYIFGSPDSGHRFFGIKTDKAASQVVLAMRDLFQVVFELKKKEIELARQHIQSKSMHDHQPITLNIKSNALESSHVTYSKGHNETNLISKYSTHKEMSPESVADLVDLEQELSSIQRGITQMERITPNEPPLKNSTEDDPFGDSFTQFSPYNLLPPPESSKSRHAKQLKPPEESTVGTPLENNPSLDSQSKTKAISSNNGNWLNSSNATNVDETNRTNDTNSVELRNSLKEAPKELSTEELGAIDDLLQSSTISASTVRIQQYVNAFSDLDPLGTGKIRPYIDKKYFFQDLKNPPKKVLKDLSDRDGTFSTNFPSNLKVTSEFASFQEAPTSTSLDSHSTLQPATVSRKNSDQNDEFVVQFPGDTQIFSPNNNGTHGTPPTLSRTSNGNNRTMLVTETDPFSPRVQNFDPFEDDFSKKSFNAFDFSFNKSTKSTLLPDTRIGNEDKQKMHTEKKSAEDIIFNGPLQKFTKRASNMKRLQESDSFSENETAPEPPPRPDVNSHSEPPPLPPKKHFSDIVIRPRVISPLSINRETMRYDYLSATKQNHSSYDKQNTDDPPSLPLPLRRIGRPELTAISNTTIQYPGPVRPEKKREDDYLTPISIKNDVPLLHPPPKAKGNRNRRPESTTPNLPDGNKMKNDMSDQSIITQSIPDITLSQLLTLGIDDLASKLNVPSSKLSTMTIVQLTKYLSDYIETSSQKSVSIVPENSTSPVPLNVSQLHQQQQVSTVQAPPLKTVTESSAVFKVSFDDSNDATFIAKFDDNFGIDSFIPNFDQFNQTHNSTVDKYAVFREIIDQELKSDSSSVNETKPGDGSNEFSSDAESPMNEIESLPVHAPTKIDTKITEAISQAKDRYAALRDIILVEDLFEKSRVNEFHQLEAIDQITEIADNLFTEENEKEYDEGENSSPDANISINLEDHDESDPLKIITTPTISQPILSNKDDLEIDEYMNRAISNLSLDSRDHLSPLSKSPATKTQYASTSPLQLQYKKSSPIEGIDEEPSQEVAAQLLKATLNSVDMSTSPIPIQSSPKPVLSESLSKSPNQLLSDNKLLTQASLTPTSPLQKSETESKPDMSETSENRAQAQEESWAVFDADKVTPKADSIRKSPREETSKMVGESPYSSDDKADWKVDGKKWPKGHTSSSSRDLSPWDDDAPDHRRRGVPSHPDRRGFYMRHARRMNSCDDEYEYEGEMERRRERRTMTKAPKNFSSRENFDSDSQNWYHPNKHRTWSPPEDDENCDQGRTFERCYERSTFGPPYEKRDLKSLPYSSDRHLYKGRDYDKRAKYNRDYSRPYEDDYDEYDRRRKEYADGMYDSYGVRSGKISKDYFYERDKRSFDRESTESFDSNGRRRKSFGSGGDVYNNLDYRERYSSADRKRSLKKSNKIQRSNEDEYEQDSEGDANVLRGPTETRSLQRRIRKSSGSSPWDGEDMNSVGTQRAWKRPASASESERKLAENRRLNQAFSGSDGEKDRSISRFHRKPRSRDREADLRSNYSSMRYPSATRGDDYEFEGPDYDEEEEEQYNTRRKDRTTGAFSERRKFEHNRNIETMHRMSRSNRDVYYQSEKDRYAKFDSFDQTPKSSSRSSSRREREFNYESYEDTPHPNAGTSKFDFEPNDQGFESDFNAAPEKNLRFSTDFSIEKPTQLPRLPPAQHSVQSTAGSSELTSTPPQQKLRFDDKITVSKFNLFEDDDFSKAEFSFENEDQWVEELPKKINLKNVTSVKRHDNIKKSESINIFARNNDDPFEDDDFFQKSEQNNNFAKFEGNL